MKIFTLLFSLIALSFAPAFAVESEQVKIAAGGNAPNSYSPVPDSRPKFDTPTIRTPWFDRVDPNVGGCCSGDAPKL